MSNSEKSTGELVGKLLGYIVMIPFAGWALQYVINFWLASPRHEPVGLGICMLAAIVTTPVVFPLWILTLFFGYLAS